VFHAAEADPRAFAPVRELTVVLLRFVALYCLFDALQIVLVGALKGAGDTRFILFNAIVVSAVALATGNLCQDYFDWKEKDWLLWGWWWVLTGWIFTLGMVYLLRFLHGAWRTMRVIEPDVLSSD
jgi:MATE family multidrug resistance protein